MLFKEVKYNCEKYQFSHRPNVKKEEYSYLDVCKELEKLSQSLILPLYNHEPVELMETDIKGNPVYIKDVKEVVLNRSYNDIHNIICRKPDFKNKLCKLNIKEPEDQTSLNFAYYLQCVYFFYILIYFVFPNVKFMDLFDEKNWSAENTLEAQTGNEIYEDFIIKNMNQNKQIKSLIKSKIKAYDKAMGNFTDAFFKFYEIEYYKFILTFYKDEFPGAELEDILELTYSKEEADEFCDYLRLVQNDLDEEFENKVKDYSKRTVFQDFLDFETTYTTKSIHDDFYENYEKIDFEKLLEANDKMIEELPEDYFITSIQLGDFDALKEDKEFVITCMNEDHWTPTIQNKFDSYNVWEAIEKVWNYEKDQIELYPDGDGFTFLKQDKDGSYFMPESDVAIIAICRIFLPYQMKYYAKRTYLENRSDGSKKQEHSIKESFKTGELDGLDISNSSFRDDLFRILCRMQQMIYLTGSAEEFLYFELPMNMIVIEFSKKAESYPYLEQRIQYYQEATKYYLKETKDF